MTRFTQIDYQQPLQSIISAYRSPGIDRIETSMRETAALLRYAASSDAYRPGEYTTQVNQLFKSR